MRLSTVFELLLIFLLIAFAAYGRVIDRDEVRTLHHSIRAANGTSQTTIGVEVMSLKQAADNVNKYCTCDGTICNCCRNFNIPIVQLKGPGIQFSFLIKLSSSQDVSIDAVASRDKYIYVGETLTSNLFGANSFQPGCASLQYLEEDKLAVQLSVGDNILTSTVINGQKPKAVCFPMPGGLTKFCGRIYSIQREADKHFKACLGLELQSSTELEAALRVGCFRFGLDGVKLRPAEQLPIVEAAKPVEEDDDDDFFGLGDDDDDDDEDDDEDVPEGNAVPDSSAISNESEDDDDDDDDVLGLGALLDILTGDDDPGKKKKKPFATTANPILPFTIPILTTPMAGLSIIENNGNSEIFNNVTPTAITSIPISQSDTDILITNELPSVDITSNVDKLEDSTSAEVFHMSASDMEESTTTEADVSIVHTETAVSDAIIVGANSLNAVHVGKPDQQSSLKKVSSPIKTMPTSTIISINAIKINDIKPSIIHKPMRPNPAQAHIASDYNGSNEDDEEADDDELFGTSDFDDDDDNDDHDDDDDEKFEPEDDGDENKDEDEDEDETLEHIDANKDEQETDQDEGLYQEEDEVDLLDDDVEEEAEDEAVLATLVEDDKKDNKTITDEIADNEAANPEEDDTDYGLGLAELLSRKSYSKSERRSKVMRLKK